MAPAGPGPLNLSGTDDASAPSIAAVDNTPYVAFIDGTPPGAHDVIVEEYGTGTWTAVGSPLPDSNGDTATGTSLASVGGIPYVAWSESNLNPSSEIDVARYSGTTWTTTAGTTTAVTNRSVDTLSAPELAAAGSRRYLAYGDTNNSTGTTNAYVVESKNATWPQVGGSVNDPPPAFPS